MKRVVVGAHYGMRDWLAQRLTAVVMVAYTFGVLAYFAFQPAISHESWKNLFAQGWMRIATLLFAVSLVWHAWVGARDILMDYVKPTGLRLGLEVATLLLLAAYLGWTVQVLWR